MAKDNYLQLTARNTVVLEKVVVSQIVNEFPVFYKSVNFITIATRLSYLISS
jgi:hypothetical protein